MTTPEKPEYDPAIYSEISMGVAGEDGTYRTRRLTWRELALDSAAEVLRLQVFRTMVTDLDRNANGRHEGDADVGDTGGVSHGNPRLTQGDVLGYDIGGRPYIMPPRGKRHDPAAWKAGR